MYKFLVPMVFFGLTCNIASAQLSERAQRILNGSKKTMSDSLLTICHPSIDIGTAKVFLFKQIKRSDSDLNGSKLLDFVSYDGKRRASFEVRSIHGSVGTLKKDATEAEKFLQRWNEASKIGDSTFTVNDLGNMKFKFQPSKSSVERVLFFSHSTPELAELRTGLTKSTTYSCSIAVVPDDQLADKAVQIENDRECVVSKSDLDCTEDIAADN